MHVDELMPAAPVDDGPMFDLRDEAQQKVVSWRRGQLERAGMDHLDACVLAVRRDVDVARCLDMLRAGCTQTLLKEIML